MKNVHVLQENDYTALLKPVGTKQTAVEWLVEQLCIEGRKTLINQAKSIEKQQIFDALSEQIVKEQERSYSEEDMKLAWKDGRDGTSVVGSFPLTNTRFTHCSFNNWFEQFKKK
jgi:hypothetical protein